MPELLMTLLKGVPATLGITFGAFAFGAVAGVPLVLMRRSSVWISRAVAKTYIDVFRGIPPVVWLFILFFGIGSGWVRLSPFQASTIGLGLISAAYLAESYRGGFLALSRGQNEAAIALGMKRADVLVYVLGPQVFRVSIPPMATYLVSLIKDSKVASTIGAREVMMLASQEAQAASGGFAPFLYAAGIYIVLSIPVAFLSRYMDTALRRRIAR